jgi:hypothetical protein
MVLGSAGGQRVRRALHACGATACLLAVAGVVTPAAGAQAAVPVANGVVATPDGGGLAWQVRVKATTIGSVPGLCFELDHAWDAEGTSFGNVAGACAAGSRNGRFSLRAGSCRGVAIMFGTGSAGDRRIRKVGLAVPRKARTVRLTFADGQTVNVRTHRAPRGLRRPVRLAWHVDGGEASPARAVARNGKGRSVGRWKPGLGC